MIHEHMFTEKYRPKSLKEVIGEMRFVVFMKEL